MESSGGVGTAGRTRTRHLDGTISGLLVRHPEGAVLVDAGSSSAFDEEIASYRGLNRMFLRRGPGSARRVALPPEALAAVGQPAESLRAVLLSHAHVDHAGGLRDLPNRVPVWLAADELRYVRERADGRTVGVIREHASRILENPVALDFPDGPYEGYARSHDVFGDGSMVIVPLSGHTPGSVGTFVNLSAERRLLHVGDAVLIREGYERLRHKGALMRSFTDEDTDGVAVSVAQLHALWRARPELTIAPAHDRTAWTAFFGDPGCVGATDGG